MGHNPVTATRSTYLWLVICTFFWGSNFNIGKYVLTVTDPMTAAAWRFTIASVVMLSIVVWKEQINWQGIRQNLLPLICLGLIGVFGFNIGFFYGMQSTTPINASLIVTLSPALTVILSAIVFKRTITWNQILGLLLSIFGVLIVVTGGSLERLTGLHFSIGDVEMLGGVLCWVIYGVMGRSWVKGLSTLQITAATIIIGSSIMLAFALTMHRNYPILPEMKGLISLLIMGIFGTAIAYLCWNNGLQKIGPAKTAVFFDLVPIFTMLIAATVGEKIILAQGLGAILVMLGVLFSSGLLSKN